MSVQDKSLTDLAIPLAALVAAGKFGPPLLYHGARMLAGAAVAHPLVAAALTGAAVMNPVEANAGEQPYYTINPVTGKYEPNPAMNGNTPPGGTPTSGSAAPAPSGGPLPFAGPYDAAMPQGSPGAAPAGSPLLQMAQAFMHGQGGPGLGTLAGGGGVPSPQPQQQAFPPQAAGPQLPPQPSPGFYGGSPATNPNLQPIGNPDYGQLPEQTPPYTPPGAALIQKMIAALGGVTNGGPLSPIGNAFPGKFGGF